MPSDSTWLFILGVVPDVLTRFERLTGPGLLVSRRRHDGRLTVDEFPEEVDIGSIAGAPPGLARIERGRLYISAANGEAVYVPLGPSLRGRGTRYGRLYQRMGSG